MKRGLIALLKTTLVILFIYGAAYAANNLIDTPVSNSGTYTVAKVYDGDTIEVVMNNQPEKIRFIGVNTPETGGNDTDIECYGFEATDFIKDALEGERVVLFADPDSNNRDIYGRLLRYVVRERDNYDINLELIKQGYSKKYNVFPHSRRAEFAEAALTAKNQNVGLWAACSEGTVVSNL